MAEGYEHSEEKDYLEEMLNNFAKATELGIIAVNTYGEVFLASKDYYECAYCRQVQDTEVGRARCRRTYKKACRQAFLWKEPYFFACHAGLVMWAVPIYADGTEVGAVMCGQVLLWEPDRVFCQDAEKFCLSERDRREMEQKVKKLRVISADQCQSSASLKYLIDGLMFYLLHNIESCPWNLRAETRPFSGRLRPIKKTLFCCIPDTYLLLIHQGYHRTGFVTFAVFCYLLLYISFRSLDRFLFRKSRSSMASLV